MVLASVISQYLAENRRLIVPQLGAFLVKEPGHCVVFSSLLTRDDGVLRQLLLDGGVSELAASGLIDRLVFDVRYVAENGGEYILAGVGRFCLDGGGNLSFEADPMAGMEPVQEVVADVIEPAETIEPVAPIAPIETPIPSVQPSNPIFLEELQRVAVKAEKVVVEPVIVPETAAETVAERVPETNLTEPDPDLEGLSYGDRRASSRGVRSASSRGYKPKKGVDWWLVIGAVAMVLAVAAILYGFLREGAEPLF